MTRPICRYCGEEMADDEDGLGYYECNNNLCDSKKPLDEF
jgi:hypothetical protein